MVQDPPPADWSLPWYAPFREPGEQVERHWHDGPLHSALNAIPGAPVRFVPQHELPDGVPYETFIHDRGCCPVRENLHDFFNGLVWLAFPESKRALNRLQAGEIARRGAGATRGPVRDAITVFDENGALLHAPPALWEALLARNWRKAFIELRPLWQQARLHLFGHALLEKLAAPRKDMTAHVWCAPTGPLANAPSNPGELDAWLCTQITVERLAAKPFTPLPVLGVPGWWRGNEVDSFYDDPQVFRPRRP
ncbi:DUF3025 domain-containing protein [Ramlibacter sp.]|uniref:DUF3025 domain-containing protein n=1 Tax=Ramlibacter sp. TaxID=1917967 RepID=UPI003D0FB690